jgi:hypothetical protein
MPEGYCVKERKKIEIKDAQQVTMKNGRPAIQGTCPGLRDQGVQDRQARVIALAAVAPWATAVIGLSAFVVGVVVGVFLAWEDVEWHRGEGRRRGGFVSPGMSRERLGFEDELRERRGNGGNVRRVSPTALEEPPQLRPFL